MVTANESLLGDEASYTHGTLKQKSKIAIPLLNAKILTPCTILACKQRCMLSGTNLYVIVRAAPF